MYVIHAGRVRITKGSQAGTKTLAILGPGEFFGEMAILNEKPRTATADVVEDARLLVIDAKMFEQMVLSNAEIAVRLIKKLAVRLDAANEFIEALTHRDPKARVILGLSREASVVGTANEDGTVLIPLDAEQLGVQLGLSLAEISDVLNRLSRLGIIEQPEGGVLVRDMDRLHEFYDFLGMQHGLG